MTSIAQAYVEILPSTRGMGRALQGEMGGVESTVQDSTRRGFLGGFRGVGGAIAGAVGVAGIAAVGAGIGATLTRGLGRALNLQDARAQLTGLGHDAASVEAVMGSALDSVRGTAFGLDAAATTAAGAVAAGIAPGQDLTRTLSLVADAATIAGTDMGSMGSIFNKVAASDMIQGDVLAQLGDAGIPVLQFLSTELGVTSEAVREMASRGEIDFATFQAAMETGLGGAAQASGDTARGALANVGAAVGRIGAMFAGGAVAGAPVLFQSIAGAIDRVGEVIAPVAAQLGGSLEPALVGLAGFIDNIDFTALTAGGGAFGAIAAAVGPLVPAFLELFSSLSPISILFQALMPMLPTIGGLLAQIGSSVVSVLVTALTALAPVIQVVVAALSQILAAVLPLVPALLQLVTPLLQMVMAVLPPLVSLFMSLLQPLLQLAVTIVGMLLPPIMALLQPLIRLVSALLPPLVELFFAVVGPILQLATTLLTALMPAILFIVEVISTLITWIAQAVSWFVDLVTGAGTASADLQAIFEGIPAFIEDIFSGIGSWLVDSGRALIQGFIDGISGMIGAVGDAVGGVMDFVAGFFPNSPAKRGPLSGSGWRAIGRSGGAIEDAFASGFSGRIDDVMTSGVPVPRVPMSAEVASYAAGQGGGGVSVTVNSSAQLDEYLVADVAANAVARAIR